MRTMGRIITYIILSALAIRCTLIAFDEGIGMGFVYFLLGLVFLMVFKRLITGPRNLSYGYKNGYATDRVDWHGIGEYRPGHSFDEKIDLF